MDRWGPRQSDGAPWHVQRGLYLQKSQSVVDLRRWTGLGGGGDENRVKGVSLCIRQ